MKPKIISYLVLLLILTTACSKPLSTAKTPESIKFISASFSTADAQDAYYAVRWALKITGYPIAKEDQKEGLVTTTWVPTTSDSHALDFFGRDDYGVNGGYYRLEVRVSPQNGRTRIEVGSRAKSVAYGIKSTGVEEKKVLNEIGNYLRVSEPAVTNIGLEE